MIDIEKLTEPEIQSLKSQEAKDLCIELWNLLKAKQEGPISPGEVQLQELEFEIRLKEAEAADQRVREQAELKIKQLEWEIEKERVKQIEATKCADQVREGYATIIAHVRESEAKLSSDFQRMSREFEIKSEMMEKDFETRKSALEVELLTLGEKKEGLLSEIEQLSEIKVDGEGIEALKLEINHQQEKFSRLEKELVEELENAKSNSVKDLQGVEREHEVELADLKAKHRKDILELNKEAASQLLQELGLAQVSIVEFNQLKQALNSNQKLSQDEKDSIRDEAIESFRRQYNFTTSGELDVTELFYNYRSAQNELQQRETQITKLENEVARMRTHIEQESSRLSMAVEAARGSKGNATSDIH